MNPEQLKEAFNEIDDRLIAEAEEFKPEYLRRKKSAAFYIIPACITAASVALVIGINLHTDMNGTGNTYVADNGPVTSETSLSSGNEPVSSYVFSVSSVFTDVPEKTEYSNSRSGIFTLTAESTNTAYGAVTDNTSSAYVQRPVTASVSAAVSRPSETTSPAAFSGTVSPVYTEKTTENPQITVIAPETTRKEPSVTAENTIPDEKEITGPESESLENLFIRSFECETVTGKCIAGGVNVTVMITEDGEVFYLAEGERRAEILVNREYDYSEFEEMFGKNYRDYMDIYRYSDRINIYFHTDDRAYISSVYSKFEDSGSALSVTEYETLESVYAFLKEIIITSDRSAEQLTEDYPELELSLYSSSGNTYSFRCASYTDSMLFEAVKRLKNSGDEFTFIADSQPGLNYTCASRPKKIY